MVVARMLVSISVFGLGPAFAQAADAEDPASPAAFERWKRAFPRWLQLGGEYRSRFESADGIRYTTTNDAYLLSRFRVNLKIQPVKWLVFFGEAQDSHVFFNHHVPEALPYQNSWDVRQAYIQMGSSKKGWADVIVGRQVLAFGDERVIGPSDWVNAGRTFDAVRLDLHHGGYKVSVFASSVVAGVDEATDHHLPGNNLYGIYGSFKNAIPRATLEPYVLWRLAPGNAGLPETAGRGHLDETTIGVRLAGALPGAFDYDIELDRQTGSLGTSSIRAWAGYWSLGRTFRSLSTTPRVFIESNYASGSRNPAGHTWGTFDSLYPSNHDKLDFADLFGRKNIQQVRAGVEETIGKKWKLRQTYEDLWLATTYDALYASSGSVSLPANPTATSRHIGQEIDFTAQYQFNKDFSAGFGCARLFSGRYLKSVSPGKDYTYPFVYLTYRF
jgi:hypothetical protein